MQPRNTFRYILKDRRQTVQFGITNGPRDRAMEHVSAGKRFTSMTVVGSAVTRDSALDWERAQIKNYQQSHGGKMPRYNKV